MPGTRDNRKLQRGSTGCTKSLFIERITTSWEKKYPILFAFAFKLLEVQKLQQKILVSIWFIN
jgi:hypothetical protein